LRLSPDGDSLVGATVPPFDVDFVGTDRKSPTAEERLLERLDALDKIAKELRTLVTTASTADADPEQPHQGQIGQTEIG
jgi:hypothetical protein